MTIRKYQYDDAYFIMEQDGFLTFNDYEDEEAYSRIINSGRD